jgi:hypothetical protein
VEIGGSLGTVERRGSLGTVERGGSLGTSTVEKVGQTRNSGERGLLQTVKSADSLGTVQMYFLCDRAIDLKS